MGDADSTAEPGAAEGEHTPLSRIGVSRRSLALCSRFHLYGAWMTPCQTLKALNGPSPAPPSRT